MSQTNVFRTGSPLSNIKKSISIGVQEKESICHVRVGQKTCPTESPGLSLLGKPRDAKGVPRDRFSHPSLTLMMDSYILTHPQSHDKFFLSYDIASGSEITPSIKIDKPLVVYRFSGNVMTFITTLHTK